MGVLLAPKQVLELHNLERGSLWRVGMEVTLSNYINYLATVW